MIQSNGIDFAGLGLALLSRSRELLPAWFPAGKFVGHEYQVGSLRGEAGRSLSINANSGLWKDFAGDVRGGDLVSLFAARKGIKQGEAARILAQEIGFDLLPNDAPKRPTAATKPEPNIVKPPVGTPPPPMNHSQHGKPSRSWCYLDAAGEPLFYVARYETPDGKLFFPWCWDGSHWIAKAWPAPRPLYGLDLLAVRPEAPILVAEGEKSAEAARIIAGGVYVVVSWPNGAKAVDKADWSPLKGRSVTIWPDADEAGVAAAQQIAAKLAPHCPQIKILDVLCGEPLPPGYDAADALAEDWDLDDFDEWASPRAKIFKAIPKVDLGPSAPPEENVAGSDEWEAPIPFESFRLPSFPADALPSWLRRFVEGESLATQTPPDLAAMLALAALAVACAKKVAVLVRSGWIETVNIYVAVALPPGSRKSSVFSAVEEPIRTFEREIARDAEEPIAEAETRLKILQGQLQNAEAKAAKAKGGADAVKATQEAVDLAKELTAAHIPTRPRLIADDVTPERLATLLKEQDGRMAVLSAEGGIFEIMAGRYSDAPNFEVFLKGHAGDSLNVDRVGRPPEYVPHPALTLGLAVQPSVLAGLAGKAGFRGRGLLGRFAYSLPVNNMGRRMIEPPPLPQEVADAFKRNLQALLALPFSQDEQGKVRTELLKLSPEAAHRVTEFEAWVEPQLADHGDLGAMTDWAGKLVGLAARIAGLLHMAQHSRSAAPWDVPIASETVETAVRIGEYLIPHARAAFALMGADPAIEDAKRLLAWVQREGLRTFSKRDAFNGLRGRFRKAADLDPVLSALVDRNYIRPVATASSSGPGRKPSPEFRVSPLALQSNSADCAYSAEWDVASKAREESSEKADDDVTSTQPDTDGATHNTQNTQNSDGLQDEPRADPELALDQA
jgi:hypothetical protein